MMVWAETAERAAAAVRDLEILMVAWDEYERFDGKEHVVGEMFSSNGNEWQTTEGVF